ncbi:hypothetical protein AMJ74_01660 [candidate division WOR_3 bacterium SM1_77]|jgi:hypothetical protein|uniref:FlgD Ig-like domain-containing protein n=1 Tax=candidate division WOR_3 bacterium SM1_77 TaxID=1703778 RepID=A0A0S8K006_UNCW3|nr:MAG: hypothetical protein AMJ74_01660 [candidate division WOR_3 bacterium SM1_77]
MRRLSVLIFLICLASGAWQFSEEIALSKIQQVSDLAISDNGEIWVLSSVAIAKIEGKSGSPLLSRETQNARAVAVLNDNIYYIDSNNRLLFYATEDGENIAATSLYFNNPAQIQALSVNGSPGLIVLEPNRLVFAAPFEIMGSLSTNADRFAIIPAANYAERRTPIFTLNGNRIFAWTGGRFINPDNYTNKLIYSTSNSVIDFCVDRKGNLYILCTDSITVLNDDGEYKGKIGVGNISYGSRILANPADNSLVIFDNNTKRIQIVSQSGRDSEELIVLDKNRPNPVDNFTEISFTLSEPLYLTITIYNLIGEPVKQIVKDHYLKGTHRVVWKAVDEQGNLVPNGVYFYRLESNKGVAIRQLIVLR